MQAEAIFSSAIRLHQEGLKINPKIMIPLIADKKELDFVKSYLNEHIQCLFNEYEQKPFPYEIGTMIELPRACLTADKLAQEADFFSFGTNDLTQMTFGFSRDDIGKFIGHYKKKGILSSDPFQNIDKDGVGELMRIAVSKARQVKPNLSIGICGEVGGDPTSISSRISSLPTFPVRLIGSLQLDLPLRKPFYKREKIKIFYGYLKEAGTKNSQPYFMIKATFP